MKFEIQNVSGNPVMLMRRAGYFFQRQEGAEMSFIRPFSQSGFPRFHIYAKMSGFDLEISIHLDQKKETYGKDTRHHGEYENEGAVGEEVERLKQVLR